MNAKTLAAAMSALALTGCASIISGTTDQVSLNSTPAGADFEIADENRLLVHSGRTPSTVTLPKSDGYFDAQEYTVKFTKPGYEDQTATIGAGLNGWYIGNLLFGGLIGMLAVDPATGAMWTLEPDRLDVTLPEDGELRLSAGEF